MARNVSKGQIAGIAAIVLALGISRNGVPEIYPGDYVGLALLALMAFWFSRPRRLDASEGQEPSQSLAFRLGKAFNYVWRGHRR